MQIKLRYSFYPLLEQVKLRIMTTFEKLQQKIKTDLGLVATDFRRTYVGREQLASGAFTWYAKTNGRCIGSGYTATYLLKREKLETTERFSFDIEVI